MRAQLALPGSERQMRERIVAEYERQQAHSAATLNHVAAVLALSGLAAAWLSAAGVEIDSMRAAAALGVTVVLALSVWVLGRRR